MPAGQIGALMIDVVERVLGLDARTEIVECDARHADALVFSEAHGVDPEHVTSTIPVVGLPDKAFACCVVLGPHRLDIAATVRQQFGAKKARYATKREIRAKANGMPIGGISPFGLDDDIPVWVDSRVLDQTRILIESGSRERKLKIQPRLLLSLPGTTVVPGLAKAPPEVTLGGVKTSRLWWTN